jgi:hypothetical protein
MRRATRYRASTATIDPVHDPATRTTCYQTSEDARVRNVSRRGMCLVSQQPPSVGTRIWVQIHLNDQAKPVELIGRTCWTRVEYEQGELGGRPICAVGIELMGGSSTSLDRFDRFLSELGTTEEPPGRPVARPQGVR